MPSTRSEDSDPVGEDIRRLIRFSDYRRTMQRQGLDESEQVVATAEALEFTTRLALDPGFFRYVWARILADRDVPGQLRFLLAVIQKEWKSGGPVPLADIEIPGARQGVRLDTMSADSTRRIIRRDFPHIVEPQRDEVDGRRRVLASLVPDALAPRPLQVNGYRELHLRPDPHALKLSYELIGIFPEMVEWSNRFNRLWNETAGRAPTANLPDDPAEDSFHERVSVWLTTREVPALWFLSHSRDARAELLGGTYELRYSRTDVERLQVALAECDASREEKDRIICNGTWALLAIGKPKESLLVVEKALEGGFGQPPDGDLHQVAACAYFDLGEAPQTAIDHARRYAEHRLRQQDLHGHVIGLLGEVSVRYALMAPRAHGPAAVLLRDIERHLEMLPPDRRWYTAAQVAIGLGEVGRTKEASHFLDLAVEGADRLPTEAYVPASEYLTRIVSPLALRL